MRYPLFFMMASVFSHVLAGTPCKDPQYLELKTASKTELRDAYCSVVLKAKYNQADVDITRDTIKELTEKQLDTSKQRDQVIDEIKAAGSCRIAAGAYSDALGRRFKAKPPTNC